MSEIEHRRLLAEQFKVAPQAGPGNLASQMQQVQREEQFGNLMQTTLNRFGSDSVNGSITSGSAAPSLVVNKPEMCAWYAVFVCAEGGLDEGAQMAGPI